MAVFQDVTNDWMEKTRGGIDVIRVECLVSPVNGEQSLLAIVKEADGRTRARWFNSNGFYSAGFTSFDLIPRPAPNPLAGLPLGHWWRRDEDASHYYQIAYLYQGGIGFTAQAVPLEIARTQWQHTPDPTDPNAEWKTGW